MNRRYFSAICTYLVSSLVGGLLAVVILGLMGRTQTFNMFLFCSLIPMAWHIPAMLRADYRRTLELFNEFKFEGDNLKKAKALLIDHGSVPVFVVELAYEKYIQSTEK